jgi:hypothetical protein
MDLSVGTYKPEVTHLVPLCSYLKYTFFLEPLRLYVLNVVRLTRL